MPIPALAGGLLPPGIHDCTLDELAERFGRPNRSDRRIMLVKKLRTYITELASTGLASCVLVDGSFVTDKPEPGDIDLITVLREDVDLSTTFRPFETNVISSRAVKRIHGDSLDVKVARENSGEYAKALSLFSALKDDRTRAKGLLRVHL